MGSDYGLQIHNRLQGDPSGFPEAFVQSGRAVFLSALTTIVGFGSLAFTDYGAMSSIGWATNFGVLRHGLLRPSRPAGVFQEELTMPTQPWEKSGS